MTRKTLIALAVTLCMAPLTAHAAGAPADTTARWQPHSMMPTLKPIVIKGKEFTVRELVARAMKGERSKLAGHANATYRVSAHVAVVWPNKKEVQTEVYRLYGDSTGYTRQVLLASKNEKFKKKDDAWVFDKEGKPDTDNYRISEEDMSRFTRVPVYLEHDEEFNFTLLDRTLEKDRVVFHCGFKPKSDFSEMPSGEIWVDGNGFRVVHELYDFTTNPFPMLIKGVRRISVQWQELPGGEWVPKQIAGEIDLRRNMMPFMPGSISFKQIWEDFRFDQGYDEKLFGGKAPAAVMASIQAPKAAAPVPKSPAPLSSPKSPTAVGVPAPPAAADSYYVFLDTTRAIVDSLGVRASRDSSRTVVAGGPALLAKLQQEDDAAYSPEVDITNHAFIDSTAALHDKLGVAGLKGGPPLYGDAWRLDFDPHVTDWDYNRVEGFLFGGGGSFGRADKRAQLDAFGGYATASEKFRWRAKFKTELPGTNHKLSAFATFRDYVDPFGSNRIAMNSLRAFFGGADDQNYLHRTGGGAGLELTPWDDVHFDLGYEGLRERSIGQDADFSVFGDLDKPNPAIDEGDEHAAVAGFELGGRRWLNAQLTQRLAGGSLGGDFRYARTDVMLQARGFILGRQEFEATVKGVTTGDSPPFQQLADIGGLSTVRGYAPRFHVGEHSFAARLEYFFPYDVFASTHIPLIKDAGVQFIPWGDAARIGDGDSNDWITSVGFGLQRYLWPVQDAANLRLDFAWPLDNPKDDFTVYLWFIAIH
ncbi:MAG TPA: hypothetical protein VJS69_01455 [Candidatus Krumholzibacteria bacterium]|nr:hypothetical protein [Candidatus Krumholzibacteria bacterium]